MTGHVEELAASNKEVRVFTTRIEGVHQSGIALFDFLPRLWRPEKEVLVCSTDRAAYSDDFCSHFDTSYSTLYYSRKLLEKQITLSPAITAVRDLCYSPQTQFCRIGQLGDLLLVVNCVIIVSDLVSASEQAHIQPDRAGGFTRC